MSYTLADPVTLCTRTRFISQWLLPQSYFRVYVNQWLLPPCAVHLVAKPITGKRWVLLRLRCHTGI